MVKNPPHDDSKEFPLQRSKTAPVGKTKAPSVDGGVMKECKDFINQIKDMFRQPMLMQVAEQDKLIGEYTGMNAQLDSIEKKLFEYKYQKATEFVSEIKICFYIDMLRLSRKGPNLDTHLTPQIEKLGDMLDFKEKSLRDKNIFTKQPAAVSND